MPAQRDPVSVLFDSAARRFLERAYAAPGEWVTTRVALPTAEQTIWAARQGIDVHGRDHLGRPRWTAGFVRAIYHQAQWYRTGNKWVTSRRMTPNETRTIGYEIGRWMPERGVIPAGRLVSIRSITRAEARRAAERAPEWHTSDVTTRDY